MTRRFLPLALCIGLVAGVASAQEPTFHFEGPVPEGSDTFFFLEFDLPEGTAEIEVVHGTRQTIGSYVWLRKGASSPDAGGCSCRVPGSPSSDGALLFSLLFLCGWWLLRRRAAGPS